MFGAVRKDSHFQHYLSEAEVNLESGDYLKMHHVMTKRSLSNHVSEVLMKLIVLVGLIMTASGLKSQEPGKVQRAYFVKVISRIADPLLNALSKNELKLKMPVESKAGVTDRRAYTYLEGFGRLLAGMSPWLELGSDKSPEGMLREKYIKLSLICIRNATDSTAPDYMNFRRGKQPLVDAAFLAQALLRAPAQLWGRLDKTVQLNVIRELKSSRLIKPYENNWLLFSAMVEAAIFKFTGECQQSVIDYAVRKHFEWYKGDGFYGDGPGFHWDYYNSFVIQPMMLEVLKTQVESDSLKVATYDTVLRRAIRYATIQERLIAPDGSFPAIGRSLSYRFGAFQHLAKMALMDKLAPEIKKGQVRYALYTLLKKQISVEGNFDKAGWLKIGFAGSQKDIGEGYISTGSLYLCSQLFLVLGLPANHHFWMEPNADWTAVRVWKGLEIPIDHAID